MLVHARHKLEAFPSGLGEGFLRPHADLLDGFEAVADKRRADYQHALDALLGQARHLEVSVRLQPRTVSYNHLTLPTKAWATVTCDAVS